MNMLLLQVFLCIQFTPYFI